MGLIFNGNGDVIKAVDGSLTVEGIDLGGGTNIVAGVGTFSGNLNVGGVLTYEDVKNVDSVGIITARNAIVVSEDNAIHFRGTAVDDADAILRASAGGGQLLINSRNDTILNIDSNNDGTDAHFAVAHGAATGSSNELFRVQEDGNMALGTSSPNNYSNYTTFTINGTTGGQLDIESSGTKYGDIYTQSNAFHVRNKQASGSGFLAFHTTNSGTCAERLRINSSGQVSIGNNPTVASDAALHIELDGTKEYLRLEGDGGTSNAYIELEAPNNRRKAIIFKSGGTRRGVIGVGDSDESSATSLFFSASTNVGGDSPHMVIDSSGKVGIGEGTPTSLLHLKGSAPRITLMDTGGSNDYAKIFSTGGALYFQQRDDSAHGKIIFRTEDNSGASERLRIASSGYVGINEASPDAPLHITGGLPHIRLENSGTSASAGDILGQIDFKHNDSDDAGVTAAIKCTAEDNAGNSYLTFHNGDGGNATERLRITSDGKIGVNESSPGCLSGGIHLVHSDAEGTPTFTGGETAIFQRNYNSAQSSEISIVSGTASKSTINFGDKDDVNIGMIQYENNNNALVFTTNTSERVRITSGGCLAIGTASPGQPNAAGIHIKSGSNDDCRIAFETPNKASSRIGYYGLSNRFGMDVYNGFEIRDVGNSYATRFKVDNNGQVTKEDSCAFNYNGNGNQSLTNGATISSWRSTDSRGFENTSSGGYLSNGIFTAPVTGAYYFTSTILLSGLSSNTSAVHVFWQKNGTGYYQYWNTRFPGDTGWGYGGYVPAIGACTMYMSSGDTCRIKIFYSGNNITFYAPVGDAWSHWSGFLIG